MDNKNTHDFFEYINHECLIYRVDMLKDGSVRVKWKDISAGDYICNEQTINKINIHVRKSKDGNYLMDFFQEHQTDIYWVGFQMSSCSGHTICHIKEDNLFDVVFYFDKTQELKIHKVSMEVIFILQYFFYNFT
jgi:hypothetical protein